MGNKLPYAFSPLPCLINRLDPRKLSYGEKVCLSVLLKYSASGRHRAFPGIKKLAFDLGCSTSQATRFLSELDDKGYIKKYRRGRGLTNLYDLSPTLKLIADDADMNDQEPANMPNLDQANLPTPIKRKEKEKNKTVIPWPGQAEQERKQRSQQKQITELEAILTKEHGAKG